MVSEGRRRGAGVSGQDVQVVFDVYMFNVGAAWCMAGGVRRMNEVNARRARLVLGLVTVFGRVCHLGM